MMTESFHDIIRELDRMIITRNGNDKFSLRYALTASQKNIFRALGMSEERKKRCPRGEME